MWRHLLPREIVSEPIFDVTLTPRALQIFLPLRGIGLIETALPIDELGSELVVGPLGHRIWPAPQHISHVVGSAALGWRQALTTLVIVWTFAAFGEELSYRGYLLTRAADIFGRSDAAYILAMILVALLFGFGHYYKGTAGVLDSTYSGLVLGCAYLLSGRNLWAAILAHGISDTFALLVVFMGWAN